MIIKSKTIVNIRMSMVDYFNAKESLESIKKQFKSSNKALASMLMGTLTAKRYDRMIGIYEHI